MFNMYVQIKKKQEYKPNSKIFNIIILFVSFKTLFVYLFTSINNFLIFFLYFLDYLIIFQK